MKVLLAVDGSDHADKALTYYFANIHKEGNEVIVYSHAKIPGIPKTWLGGMPMLTHEEIDRLIANHKKECHDLKEKLKKKCEQYGDNITVSVESHDGGAGCNIIKKAESSEAGLIVTGTRGLGKISSTVLGSVSDYVLHHAKIPVIICHT
uniref:Uncharacterized protein LOC100180855 n=1 Tax=Phallusia mammillata TaxID=59560 RepID=A0A6F9DHD1_9ASCI|nr:uncharacterized protein LOC100180855 [Phallusia mammillata]